MTYEEFLSMLQRVMAREKLRPGSITELNLAEGSVSAEKIASPTLGAAWPVGSVYLSVVDTNPATLFGFGTWSQIAGGKFLVGQTIDDADFDVAEETGGAKTKNLSHTHGVGSLVNAAAANHAHDSGTLDTENEAGHVHSVNPPATDSGTPSTTDTAQSGSGVNISMINHVHTTNIGAFDSATGGAHSHNITGSTAAGGSHNHNITGSTAAGGSATQDILPPYFVAYFWKRTA